VATKAVFVGVNKHRDRTILEFGGARRVSQKRGQLQENAAWN
jgi:hypothetical protein